MQHQNSGVCVQREIINGDTFYKYTLSNDSATQINAATATVNAVAQDLSEKADITYVDAQNNAQNTVINSKASTADVKNKNDSQDTEIAANKTAITTNKNNITNLQNTKADISYVNEQLSNQNTALSATNQHVSNNTDQITANQNYVTTEITRLDGNDVYLQEQINNSNDVVNNRITEIYQEQVTVDYGQSYQIADNSQRIAGLDYRVNELDKQLSAGIASSIALSQMPSSTRNGASMMTFGSGYYNGQPTIAVGVSGSTEGGNASCRLGTSWTQEGGSAFGLGAGFYFR